MPERMNVDTGDFTLLKELLEFTLYISWAPYIYDSYPSAGMNQVQQQSASLFFNKKSGIGISLIDETDLGGPIIKTVLGSSSDSPE